MTHVDVLIVGAGLSGIGAAAHLSQELPQTSYLVLERRDAIGGTWDLFRYPGIRSDSDMHTLGYRFRPWASDQVLADGPSIKKYVIETAEEYGVTEKIRFGQRATRYSWDSDAARWTVHVDTADGPETYTCDLLWNCSGYYDYDEPYRPELPGLENFRGEVLHPQTWPEDLDYAGKKVVVIGSGATAITIVPAMAREAAKVTMLQRTPTYVVSVPSRDKLTTLTRRVLPERPANSVTRWRNVLTQAGLYQLSRRRPETAKNLFRKQQEAQLPEGYPIDPHFTPPYDPWDQRLCVVPSGDLFKAIRKGTAEIATGHIETFTEHGVRLKDGTEIEADIVVTATGLSLLAFGGAELELDGEKVDVSKRLAYKGLMLDGIPNFVYVVGYANASWTLKADLVSEWTVRLIKQMRAQGARVAVARREDGVGEVPLLDLNSGYVQRALDRFPAQGDRGPWKAPHNYLRDILVLRRGKLDDGRLELR